MGQSPIDIFIEWLSNRPLAARMAIAVDGDRLLTDSGLVGRDRLTDNTGREWRLVVFRGDDLAFRLMYRKARSESHVLIVLVSGVSAESRIHVSFLTDILARNEGGEPLDLSVPAVFRRICPKINFPPAVLRQFKDTLLEQLDGIPEAAKKIIERWGRPDDWGRGQVAALALLVRHPHWILSEIWPDELDPADGIAHAFRILMSVPEDTPDLTIVRQVLTEAVQPQVKPYLFWLDQRVELMAAYLVIRRFANDIKLQNPVVQLSGLQVFPVELAIDKLEPLALSVIEKLSTDNKVWKSVEGRAEEFITTRHSEKLTSLIESHPPSSGMTGFTSAIMLLPYVRQRLQHYFLQPNPGNLEWVVDCQAHAVMLADETELTDQRKYCQAIIRLAGTIRQIESRLAEPLPQVSHAEQLLDWYIHTGYHMLELNASRSIHDWHNVGDGPLYEMTRHYLLGGDDEQSPAEDSLLQRVRKRLDELDLLLSKFIAASPEKFEIGPRSFVSFISQQIGNELAAILTGDSDKRVWVLIFDGMRYDTWQDVVQPMLGEHFQIDEQPRFCTLPSYTLYARRSVLAGSPPSVWAAGKNPASRTEPQLLAENLGLGKHEAKDKIRLVTDADTTKARSAKSFKDSTHEPVNVLIYPISDECHEFRGDLAAFNAWIRQQMLGDRKSGIRGILDDLLRRVRPDDIILATSDHGFIELSPARACTVAENEVSSSVPNWKDAVHYRYATQFVPKNLSSAVQVDAAGEPHTLCVGRSWLKREGASKAVRYSHGGISFSEMVVPAARLNRITEKRASVEISNLPEFVTVDEDAETEVQFFIKNQGTLEVEYDVTVRTNLDQVVLQESGKLQPAASRSVKFSITGTFRALPNRDTDAKATLKAMSVRLKHTNQAGQWRDAADGNLTIPVTVHPKKTKLTTDALAGFDDL